MKTNTSMTVYNKKYDTTLKDYVYQRTVVSAVLWNDRKATNTISSGGDKAANQAVVYVPIAVASLFLEPKQWLSNPVGYWTLQTGDLIVKGSVSDEITALFTPSNLIAKYDHVLKINSVDFYSMGSTSLHHWKVGAA